MSTKKYESNVMKNSYLKLVKLNHYLLDLGQNLHPVSLLENFHHRIGLSNC